MFSGRDLADLLGWNRLVDTLVAVEDPASGALRFKEREVYASADFSRALELMRLGLHESASAELAAPKPSRASPITK